MGKVWALLVGINDYPAPVRKLRGCLNDVDSLHGFLGAAFPEASVAVLKDAAATRAAVIAAFRTQLGQAGPGDVALFQFCGHGAQSTAAPEFREFFPDGHDEGLVCVDSRLDGGHDLADKELGVLVAEVAAKGVHVAVVLDCCHSGSGTRAADAFDGLAERFTSPDARARTLETYLDGHYTRRRAAGQPLTIPAARHILLAACDRTETAKETDVASGVFTSTLIEVLTATGGDLTYADLFMRCRAAVRARARNQNPQFEAFDDFGAQAGFLGRDAANAARRYDVYAGKAGWVVACGAINGLPAGAASPVRFRLYALDGTAAGTASAFKVGPRSSLVTCDFAADPHVHYRAEIVSLPVAPLLVAFTGNDAARAEVAAALDADQSAGVALSDAGAARTDYIVTAGDGGFDLAQSATGKVIEYAGSAEALLATLKHVAQWERGLALANPATAMDARIVDFGFVPDGETAYRSGAVTLDYVQPPGAERVKLRGRLKARHRAAQPLFLTLVYFSRTYGIRAWPGQLIEAGADEVTLWSGGLYLGDGVDETVDAFKLIVSTEPFDSFLLPQPGLDERTRDIDDEEPASKFAGEWFTLDCRIRLVRRQDSVGTTDARLADGAIVVKAHPTLRADLSLAAAAPATRALGDAPGFLAAYAERGMALVDFGTGRGEGAAVLELSGIEGAASLAGQPLEIEVRAGLAAGETLVPLVSDGRHVFVAGTSETAADGTAHVSIDTLPEAEGEGRSLGSALKLYFFKTWLGHDNVNRLRWVEYRDGGFERHDRDLAAKVAAAGSVLLLIHGIIGDTEEIVRGARAIGLDRRFDLVLTYDYENLGTSIEATAKLLAAQLAAAGFGADDGKRLTLLVHSMGGLVSRRFIADGGAALVDHLVMCGTPNGGSPFGRIDGARKILKVLVGLAANYVPVLLPFGAPLLFALERSKKLSVTLEQMDPGSSFIAALNAAPACGVRTTILAGDVDTYEPADAHAGELMAKLGRGVVFDALFANKANDIAAGVESILTGGDADRRNVACHHLNYFASPAGQAALLAVDWDG